MELELKKSAIDLTELAVGLVILGIAVSIFATILLNVRDSRLTSLETATTNNESFTPSATATLSNKWGKSVGNVYNGTSTGLVASGNYTVTISATDGTITISNSSQNCVNCNGSWKVTYTWYNTSRPDWNLPNQANVGVGEFGNWFKIIVIVGIASVIIGLIFLAFGNKSGEVESGGSY